MQTLTFAGVSILGVSDWTPVIAVSGWARRTFACVAAFCVDTALSLGTYTTTLLAFVNIWHITQLPRTKVIMRHSQHHNSSWTHWGSAHLSWFLSRQWTCMRP